ncbi:MAG TPA: hypothetical protein VFF06_23925 [Polyangia bacterium]|nr:hypothetical protein [Polyangia bacterium]
MALDSCGCDSINGTCADDAPVCSTVTINCNTGFFDCNHDLHDGCECAPSNQCDSIVPSSCPTGAAGTCQHMVNVGASCAAECQLNPTCDSSGACTGSRAPDKTVCSAPAGCADPAGECNSGVCTCAHPFDLSIPPGGGEDMKCTGPHCAGGNSTGSCSMTTNGAAPIGAWTLLALLGVALLLRRRSA